MRELENKQWFFLDGDLHRYISSHRAKNQMKAFNYREQKVKVLTLSEAKKYRQNAFSISQVASILNRSRRTIYWYIETGKFLPSGKAHRPTKTSNTKWWYSEDDVIELRDVIYEQSLRAPVQRKLPSRDEVRTMVKTKKMLYVQQGEQFVPVWEADNW